MMTDEKHSALFDHIKTRWPQLKGKFNVDCVIEHAIAQKALGFEFSIYSMRGTLEEFGFRIKTIEGPEK